MASGTAEIRLEFLDGTTETVSHIRSRQIRALGRKWKMIATAKRSDVEGLSLAEGDTKVFINTDTRGDEFGGRLRGARWDTGEVELTVDSFERDMLQAQPTGPGTSDARFENADADTIIKDAVDRVSSISRGDIENVDGGLSYRFSYVSPARMVRTVTEAAGEVAYRPDQTLDYVDSLGDDKTGTTFSEGSQYVTGRFGIDRVGDDRKVNKLTVLGAGEGPSQISVDVTASGFDPDTGREKWAVYVNKDLGSEDTARTFGNRLIDELNSEYVEINTSIKNKRVNVGDEFHVKSDRKNIDADLRAVRVTEILDSDGRRYDVVFSNRERSRETAEEKVVKDAKRAGYVIEGFTVPLPVSAGPDYVSPEKTHRFSIPMPSDVIEELEINLRIRGLPDYNPVDDTVINNYPKNCDVRVNGSSLGLSFGDGDSPFRKTVDLSGELTTGAVNTIDITSEQKARTYAVLDADLYRRMTGD